MYEDLINRLNAYSAEHENHGGITAAAADAIEELSAKYDMALTYLAKQTKPRWIPVTERLPENCANVLAYVVRNAYGDEDAPYRKREIAIAYHVNGIWHVDWCSGVDCIAWQPLPEPPKEEK